MTSLSSTPTAQATDLSQPSVQAFTVLRVGFTAAPILWITYMASAVIQAALGLLLGTGTLKTFVKQPMAVEKIDQLVTKLAPYQGTLGLISIGVGVWTVVASLLFSV